MQREGVKRGGSGGGREWRGEGVECDGDSHMSTCTHTRTLFLLRIVSYQNG